MMKFRYEFTEDLPQDPEEGVLYIALHQKTALHLCMCGCKNKVITPLSPNEWKLTFNGTSVSMYPAIRNSNFSCRSHYWIKKDYIIEIKNDKKKKKKKIKQKYIFFF